MTQQQMYQYIVYLVALIVAGGAQYLHLVPLGTDVFYPVLLFVLGHVTGNIPTVNAINANTAATIANTQATTTQQQTTEVSKRG